MNNDGPHREEECPKRQMGRKAFNLDVIPFLQKQTFLHITIVRVFTKDSKIGCISRFLKSCRGFQTSKHALSCRQSLNRESYKNKIVSKRRHYKIPRKAIIANRPCLISASFSLKTFSGSPVAKLRGSK